jgi:hypothetical protein
MIKLLDIGIEFAVAFSISGKITEDNMAFILNVAREKSKQNEHIVILERIESFEGVSLSALVEEFKYLREEGFSNIKRVAVVTDKQWIGPIVKVQDMIFRSMDIKCFPLDEQDEATKFLWGDE